MRIRKWFMKQQWRIVQIRGIWGLFYGIFLLAYAYFEYIPIFAGLGMWGPVVFSGVLLVVFLILGYLYDRVFVLWAPSQEVVIERNPYQYVPSPKEHIFWFPLYSSLLDSIEKLAMEYGIDTSDIQETKEYYAEIQKLRPDIPDDLERAVELRNDFVSKHRYWNGNAQDN